LSLWASFSPSRKQFFIFIFGGSGVSTQGFTQTLFASVYFSDRVSAFA
jgi:hypothetical protein